MLKSLQWVFKKMLAVLRNGVRHWVRGSDNFLDTIAVAKKKNQMMLTKYLGVLLNEIWIELNATYDFYAWVNITVSQQSS